MHPSIHRGTLWISQNRLQALSRVHTAKRLLHAPATMTLRATNQYGSSLANFLLMPYLLVQLAESSSPESLFFDMRETQSPSINLLGMAAHIEPVECDSTIDWSTSMLQMSSSGTSLANFTSPEIHRCTEGCSKNFGRSYDLRRHIEEQHRCPHPDCKELRLATANEKKEHKREHSDMGFRCGICALAGLPPKSLSRKEKLRKHLRDIHMIPDDLDFLEFQCLQASCYLGKACGGIYFTSRQELDKHTGYQHAAKPSQDTYTDGKSYSKSLLLVHG
jgi:hypothetical protein